MAEQPSPEHESLVFHICGHCGDWAQLPNRVKCKCASYYKYFSYPKDTDSATALQEPK